MSCNLCNYQSLNHICALISNATMKCESTNITSVLCRFYVTLACVCVIITLNEISVVTIILVLQGIYMGCSAAAVCLKLSNRTDFNKIVDINLHGYAGIYVCLYLCMIKLFSMSDFRI